jgi:hypothetical protein
MDLAVVVYRHDPHNSLPLSVACEQHRTGPYMLRRDGVSQRRPTEAVVVLCVQIS